MIAAEESQFIYELTVAPASKPDELQRVRLDVAPTYLSLELDARRKTHRSARATYFGWCIPMVAKPF